MSLFHLVVPLISPNWAVLMHSVPSVVQAISVVDSPSLAGLGGDGLYARLVVLDSANVAVRRRELAEVAFVKVDDPLAAEVGFGLCRHSKAEQRQENHYAG